MSPSTHTDRDAETDAGTDTETDAGADAGIDTGTDASRALLTYGPLVALLLASGLYYAFVV